ATRPRSGSRPRCPLATWPSPAVGPGRAGVSWPSPPRQGLDDRPHLAELDRGGPAVQVVPGGPDLAHAALVAEPHPGDPDLAGVPGVPGRADRPGPHLQ